MKILKITLENVKSYQREVIEFNDGINVIAGRNGAGKSTLIEAIGLALFGYMNKDYSYQDFLTHQATNGSISVEFAVDNCRYRIDRSFNNRGTKGWAIYDFATDETVETHSVEDVNYTLAKILGMSETISLAELFERIIGVSQGTFTEPFLRSPGGRKEYFERIFMLDSYKTAYQKSNDSAAFLRDQCDELEKELIMLRTRVENYPALKTQLKDADTRLKEQKDILKNRTELWHNLRSEVQNLKSLEKEILELESRTLQLTTQEQQLAERLSATRHDTEVSKEAKELVERYQSTHDTYLLLKNKIAELEGKLETQEKLLTEKIELEKIIAVKSEKLKTDQENLAQARTSLELESARRQEEIDEYSIPLESIDKELKCVTDETQKLAKFTPSLENITLNSQQCRNYYQQLEDRLKEIANLELEVAKIDEKLADLPRLQAEVAKIPACEEDLERINAEISILDARIFAEKENMERVGDGLCPFLQAECKNLEGRNLRDHFAEKAAELEQEKGTRTAKKSLLSTDMQLLRQHATQLTTLQVLLGEREDRERKIAAIAESGSEIVRTIYDKLRTVYVDFSGIKKAGYLADSGDLTFQEVLPLELTQEQRRLKTEMDITDNYFNLLRQELTTKEATIASKKEDLTRRKAEFSGKISQIQEQQKEILRKLAELATTESFLAREMQTLTASQEKILALTTELANFGDVKGELKTCRDELATLEEGNQIYLTNHQKATELAGLLELITRLEKNIADTTTELANVREQLTLTREKFDPAKLNQLEGECEHLNREVSQAETLISECERQKKELEERLKEMEQIKEQISAREKEEVKLKKALNLMNFIRNVYNTSAEEIAAVFLQYISHEATNIYRQLSGENVQLVWEKDYQIKLKDKHRVRVFKQLSGGEQMSAAFAIRLALLRKFSSVRLGFFDEPTTHLDEFHRLNIAQAIAGIREKGDDYFEQIFVISHDDTFTTLTENLIRIEKDDERGSYLVRE